MGQFTCQRLKKRRGLGWTDDSCDLARSGQFFLLLIASIESIQILQAASGVEQHDCGVGIEKAGVAQLAIRRERGRTFRSCEYAFNACPMSYSIGDFFF